MAAEVVKIGCSIRTRKKISAILSLLIGCGLRRAELLGLTMNSIQLREEHWVIADLVGKGGHIRTVPIPLWVKLPLFFISQRWSKGDPNQQSFRRQEAADGLAPRLFLVLDEHSIASRFKLCRCPFYTGDVKLKPSLWLRNLARP